MATTAVALLAAPALAQEIGEIEATVSEKSQPVLNGRCGAVRIPYDGDLALSIHFLRS